MIMIQANVVVEYFIKGGPIMWPILLLLFMAVAVIADRVIWWVRFHRCLQELSLIHI